MKNIQYINKLIDKIFKSSVSDFLNDLIVRKISCYVVCPHNVKVYVENPYHSYSVHELFRRQKLGLESLSMISPIEVKDVFLLELKERTLQELAALGRARAISFNQALLINLKTASPFSTSHYVLALANENVPQLGGHDFSCSIPVSVEDILIHGSDFEKLENIYIHDNAKSRLIVKSEKVSILNLVAYDYYKGNQDREYDRKKVSSMLSKEKCNEVVLNKMEIDRLAAVLNKKFNPKRGASNNKNIPGKILLSCDMERYRIDECISDALVLVNYLADYGKGSVSRRDDIESIAKNSGLSKTLSHLISTML